MYIIVSILLVMLYVTNIVSYSMGIKHGREVRQGGIPNINPVKSIKEHKKKEEEKAKQDNMQEGIQNILNYGEPFR